MIVCWLAGIDWWVDCLVRQVGFPGRGGEVGCIVRGSPKRVMIGTVLTCIFVANYEDCNTVRTLTRVR